MNGVRGGVGRGGHSGVADRAEMGFVTIFFGEDVREIAVSNNVLDVDELRHLGFADSIFPHLDVAKAFSGLRMGPRDTSAVVVVQGCGGGHKCGFEVEVVKNMGEVEEGLDTFVGGIYFGLGGRSGRDGLALGLPVDWAIEPDEEARHRAGFEEVKKGWGCSRFGGGCVLGTPVGVGQGTSGGREGKVEVS